MAHSPGHIDCLACLSSCEKLGAIEQDLASMSFADAVRIWLAIRKQKRLAERTRDASLEYFGALGRFFGSLRLLDIHAGHIREYQAARSCNVITVAGPHGAEIISPWKNTAGHSRVNHEICALSQLMRHCNLWAQIEAYYQPLAIAAWSPRQALNEEEEQKLFVEEIEDDRAQLALCVATLTVNTSAAGSELRLLQIEHVTIERVNGIEIMEIYIPPHAVKNTSRPRRIPLNAAARLAMEWVLERARRLGSTDPKYFIFPFRVKRNAYDPMRPASRFFLRKSWGHLRNATGVKHMRPHDMRHHCITRSYEVGNDEETTRSIVGHISVKMTQFYSHPRRSKKLQAVQNLDTLKLVPKKPVGSVKAVQALQFGTRKA